MRVLRVRHTKVQKKEAGLGVREVVHYQFTAWPDHGTPHNIGAVLSFIKKSSAALQVGLITNTGISILSNPQETLLNIEHLINTFFACYQAANYSQHKNNINHFLLLT